MEKLELYRKYRPCTFDEMVGNKRAIETLKKEIENGSHVFLLTGGAGQGKTTLARICANELAGDDLNIHEINSAENRGIDTIRDIMNEMRYLPANGKASVYIFDEVHQWLAPVQNAALKMFEETPQHVYFFLCTTDAQKLIEPLKTRTSIIHVKPLNEKQMTILLKRVAKKEKKAVSEDVIAEIIKFANGGSRKALKLLAKVIDVDDDDKAIAIIDESEGVEDENSIEFCRALMKKNISASDLFTQLQKLDLSNSEMIRKSVMGYMNSVLIKNSKNINAICAMQSFSNADTYKNGKFALTVAILDFIDLLNS